MSSTVQADQAAPRSREGRVHAITVNLEPASDLEELLSQLERSLVGAEDLDLIVLPESSLGVGPSEIESLDGPAIAALSKVARKHSSYVLAGLFLEHDGEPFVSSLLLDRSGQLVGIYDKRYPYWSDLEHGVATRPGSGTPRWQTDFGVLGSAICFDLNFHQVWADLAEAGVDLVVWPSAYAGGELLRSYAQIHHFHVLSCTQKGDSRLFDPIGVEILPTSQTNKRTNDFTFDLDRGVYHHNFNLEGLQQLLADHEDDVQVDAFLKDEEWFVLSGRRPGVNVRELARNYGLEEIRAYVERSRMAMDDLRDHASAEVADDDVVVGRQ